MRVVSRPSTAPAPHVLAPGRYLATTLLVLTGIVSCTRSGNTGPPARADDGSGYRDVFLYGLASAEVVRVSVPASGL